MRWGLEESQRDQGDDDSSNPRARASLSNDIFLKAAMFDSLRCLPLIRRRTSV